MLNFLGRGSAFADEHNGAYFVSGDDLILLDCPMTSYFKIKKSDLTSIKSIYVLVTHTHSDHISGIAMLIDYEYFIGHIPVTVVAPSKEVFNNLMFYLRELDGCSPEWFDIVIASSLKTTWFKSAIQTLHSPQLDGKCFGYHLNDNGRNAIYTGDTATIEPYINLVDNNTDIYMEVSSVNSDVHLYIDDMIPVINEFTSQGANVYLMHLDNETVISAKIANTNAKLAQLTSRIVV